MLWPLAWWFAFKRQYDWKCLVRSFLGVFSVVFNGILLDCLLLFFFLFLSSTFVLFIFLFHWGRGVGGRVVVLFLIFVILVFRRNKSLHVCKCVLIKMPYICPLWTPMQLLFQYLTAGITIISVEYHTHISEGRIVQLRINEWK